MRRPRLAVTLGDPAGIGPELLLKSLPTLNMVAELVVVGARAGVELLERQGGAPFTWSWEPATGGEFGAAWTLRRDDWEAHWVDPVPGLQDEIALGTGSAVSGRCSIEAIRLGARFLQDGRADALVTLPISKAAAHAAGHPFPGHTEYLQALTGAPKVRMAFLGPKLRVVLHSVHQSLRSAIDELEAGAVADTLAFSAEQLGRLEGLDEPRIALAALNPHAGEQGAFGHEEVILADALELARRRSAYPGARFSGPHSADSLFRRAAEGEFDAVVALYHDQGLIPVKTLEGDKAVNVTLGLPFVRTSPDHGTAFDKAGRWIADATNFQEACSVALRLAGRLKGQRWMPPA
ncbi:MAG TPA: 4-hydroxythreonine-4-phosphate dehydrogenase PdxA [Holophagaceae bacterium]|jgi:4-hydroxythreonine-4-phosphate dehydrogenase|nr:4-hydroxythreonine-4-phosphate dehydrogenase PdxA [Holophagaceae bacterium]